jgi:DNA-damage-inducible protein D
MEQENRIVLFQENQIRRVWHNEEWYFNIVDIISVLTNSVNPRMYWAKLKERMAKIEGASETLTICQRLKFETIDGKKREMDAANTRVLLRIVQSIPSPNAEPFKLWLSEVGYERIQEIENPELAAERARELYKAKGYPDEWIEMRLKSIEVRQQLTDEWKVRSVQEGREYAILTAEISKATFGLTPSEYKDFKSLKKENLRDHMTNLELIFTMLGEESTRREAVNQDAQGFEENHVAAKKGGRRAGKALEAYEQDKEDKVVTNQNFLQQIAESGRKNPEIT